MLTQSHTQEALSLAYAHALSGVAGVNIYTNGRHDYGIDGTFKPIKMMGRNRVEDGYAVDFQLRSTIKWELCETFLTYDLDAKTFNHMVGRNNERTAIPAVLILLCLPSVSADWLLGNENELILRRCCYWTFLKGDVTTNTSTQRITIPRTSVLTADAIKGILADEREKWSRPC